jgi:hypothetical protein
MCGWLIAAISIHAQVTSSFHLTSLDAVSGGWRLAWPALGTNSAYSIQFQDSPEDQIWRLADSPVPFPVSSNTWLSSDLTNTSRFFRVVGVPGATRGRVISVNLSNTLSTATLTFLFSLAGVNITPQYDVQMYQVVYETIDPTGARTIASGALILPQNPPGSLPLVSYQHGTVTLTNDAPSSMDLTGEVTVGVAFATTGYAAVVPDYLGLGVSRGLHPYHHARSEATAAIDLLRAAKTFCASQNVALNSKLFLVGYSQGGHATMALLRELEKYHTNEFTVTACAPMAGAYDLSGVTTSNFLSGAVAPNPYYFLYILAAYQSVYHFAPQLSDLLAAPYDSTLPPLLDGAHDGTQINAALPSDPIQILKPAYLAEFRSNPRHPLRLALADNDLYRWLPHAPLRLYHCAADQDVIYANSQVALASFQSQGDTNVQLIDPIPTADHSGCSEPSLALAKAWFDSLR